MDEKNSFDDEFDDDLDLDEEFGEESDYLADDLDPEEEFFEFTEDDNDFSNNTPNKETGSLIKPLILVLLLGGLGFGAYKTLPKIKSIDLSAGKEQVLDLLPSSSPPPPPIENQPLIAETPATKQEKKPAPSENNKKNNRTKAVQSRTPQPQEQADQKEPLTPLPNDIETQNIVLPDLLAQTPDQNPDLDVSAKEIAPPEKTAPKTTPVVEPPKEAKIVAVKKEIAEPKPAPAAVKPQEKTVTPAAPKTIKPKVQTIEKVAPPPPKKPTPTEKTKKTWVIRAAKPGKALIYNEKTGEVKSVEVGDTIDPYGAVLSIESDGNRWIIKTAKQTIK